MATFKAEIILLNLLMHNGRTANPADPFAKAMKAVSGKRNKTDADFEQMANIEYEAGLYTNRTGQVVIPGRLLEAMIIGGARKSKEGKLAESGLFIDEDAVISYDGGPLSVAELIASDAHRLSVPVKVGQAKVVRTRPYFENVRFTVTVDVEESIANASQAKRWIEDGLRLVGLGDWRPRKGRGNLISFEAVKAPVDIKKVA
jgi:hypothetical protein